MTWTENIVQIAQYKRDGILRWRSYIFRRRCFVYFHRNWHKLCLRYDRKIDNINKIIIYCNELFCTMNATPRLLLMNDISTKFVIQIVIGNRACHFHGCWFLGISFVNIHYKNYDADIWKTKKTKTEKNSFSFLLFFFSQKAFDPGNGPGRNVICNKTSSQRMNAIKTIKEF